MFYTLYLISLFVSMIGLIVLGGGYFSYFIDAYTLIPLVCIVLLALVGTQSIGSFGDAFLYAFKQKQLSKEACETSLLTLNFIVRIIMAYSILVIIIHFICVLGQLSTPSSIGPLVLTIILPLLYSVLSILILCPLQLMLKRALLVY